MYNTGSYNPGGSFLHRIDPRIKFSFVIFLSIIILTVNPLTSLFIGMILFLTALSSGIRLKTIGEAVKPLIYFITLIFLVHLLFTEEGPRLAIPYTGLSLSRTGLSEGVFVSWRFLCLILAAVLLTMTTPPSRMTAAVRFLLHPLKLLRVPVDSIAVMIMLALRLMPVLLNEKARMDAARKARGENTRHRSPIFRLRIFLSFSTRLLLDVFKRADALATAMEARNFQIAPRTSFVELKLRKLDFIILFFIIFFIIILIALNSCFG